jgi:phosphoglycolate phosphatase-like HAD superfamily hydrolase
MIKSIVFDFDGVILESADIKTEAFSILFSKYPDHVEKIVKLHIDNAGISRFEKFKIIYRDYIGQTIKGEVLVQLGNQFSSIIYEKILCCPFVPGAYEFLKNNYGTYRFHVASSTPEYELRDIIKQRNIHKFFSSIHGSPETKCQLLQKIVFENNYKSREIIFVGDSKEDYLGAKEASVPFIGRVRKGSENPFPIDESIIMIVDDLRQLDRRLLYLAEKLHAAGLSSLK